ncbi:MAG TPA: hypothetical protein VIW25_04255 [Nitrososphaeraceae archaeon]
MSKPNWSCTECGMFSAKIQCQRTCKETFIRVNGFVVSFVDYVVGGLTVTYHSISLPGQGSQKNINFRDTFQQRN